MGGSSSSYTETDVTNIINQSIENYTTTINKDTQDVTNKTLNKFGISSRLVARRNFPNFVILYLSGNCKPDLSKISVIVLNLIILNCLLFFVFLTWIKKILDPKYSNCTNEISIMIGKKIMSVIKLSTISNILFPNF